MAKKFQHRSYIKELLIWICQAKNADPHKYKYSGFNIGFDSHSEFPFIDGSMEKNF